MTYTITVVEDETYTVVKLMLVEGTSKARKTYNGLSDRVDWEKFTVNIDPELEEAV